MHNPLHFTAVIPVVLSHANYTTALLARLRSNYPGLSIEQGSSPDVAMVDELSLPPDAYSNLKLDLEFYDKNPSVPLENICSHLHQYIPQNESQEELLKYANILVGLDDDSTGAGIYMWGDAGIGKSHLSVALSKIFMARGLYPIFMSADAYSFDTRLDMQPGQVWIIDDMNSGYGIASRLFKKVVLHTHDKGGRIFVTSNKPYDQLMHEAFVGDGEANRMRYDDRTKGMFKILHVTGMSHRQEHTWYNSP
ncbi:MAG: ATP-binding protein [Candidatus Kapabacteria bacterium]|nr:ATP-binding protein [Candidatus Kapabacteria bacterium]